MVLLALGDQLHRACCKGSFNMSIRQGDHKMTLSTCPAKLFCACMAYKGCMVFPDDWPAAGG
jgi:hypothetical protein